MTRAAEAEAFRARSAACEVLADQARLALVRERWRTASRAWLALAQRCERGERGERP